MLEQVRNTSIPAAVLQRLLGGLADGVVLTDQQERITYMNAAAAKILASARIVPEGTKFSDVCPLWNLKKRVAYESPIQQAIRERRSVGLSRNVGIFRENEPVYLSATCSPLYDQDDHSTVVGCMTILRDVTHMRRLEMKIEADHLYMRNVFSAASVGLCLLNEKGEILDINDTGLEIMQRHYNEALGSQFGDAFRCENSAQSGCGHGPNCSECPVRHNIETAIATEGYRGELTAAMHSLNNLDPIWLKIFFSQTWTESGKQIILSMVDVSQRKKREAELQEAKRRAEAASRTKSQFLANMSHEIRTPINGMNGMIELTLRSPLTEEQRENLMSARQCADDLLRIINDILDFSKLESGNMELEHIGLDLPKILRRVVRVHSKVAKGKGLYFCSPNYSHLPNFIMGDPLRLRQILHNLLSNAIKFTQEGGIKLDVKVIRSCHLEKSKPLLQFSVHDTGIGMTVEEQNKLFQPFRQVDGSITRRFGGTGLGLTIVKELVEAMGGSIMVRSAPTCGSCFTFCIPLEEAEEASGERRDQTVYINPHRQENEDREEKPVAKPKAETVLTDDIASLLAYCEQKLEE